MNIKNIRLKLGLTQDELSKKTNVCRATINRIENGSITTTETLDKILNPIGYELQIRKIKK